MWATARACCPLLAERTMPTDRNKADAGARQQIRHHAVVALARLHRCLGTKCGRLRARVVRYWRSGRCRQIGIPPSKGRVSRYGIMPLSHSLDCIGVLARNVGDCARVLSVIGGADDADGMSSRHPVPDYERDLDDAANPGSLAGVRVGVPDRYYDEGLDQEVAELLAASRAVLEAQGAK